VEAVNDLTRRIIAIAISTAPGITGILIAMTWPAMTPLVLAVEALIVAAVVTWAVVT
jgi:hypothetical protein